MNWGEGHNKITFGGDHKSTLKMGKYVCVVCVRVCVSGEGGGGGENKMEVWIFASRGDEDFQMRPYRGNKIFLQK